MKHKFLTAGEASKVLRVNIMTIYRYIKAGKIEAYKVGKDFRIQQAEFDKFLDKIKVKKGSNDNTYK